jgi:hypothetical protein
MAWILVTFTLLLVLVAALGYGFFLSARALMRDMNRRMAAFETRLEQDANDLVNELLNAKRG